MDEELSSLRKDNSNLRDELFWLREDNNELKENLGAARNVARIAKQALGDARRHHANDSSTWEKERRGLNNRICTLEASLEKVKEDASLMCAMIEGQDAKLITKDEEIALKNGQIAFLTVLVDQMADAIDNGRKITYQELVEETRAVADEHNKRERERIRELSSN